MGELVRRVCARQPEAHALLAPGRQPLSYAALSRLVAETAGGLRATGIHAESRVAVLVENGPEAASAFLSIASAAVVAPLNPLYREQELAFYLDDLRADAIVVDARLETPARRVAEANGVRVIELRADLSSPAGIFALDGVQPQDLEEIVPPAGDLALLLHTSGTTSRPKLVPLTHGQLTRSAANVADTLELNAADRCLNVMPLFHIHGLVAALLASLHTGSSVACTPGFHQLRFFDWLDETDPTWYTAVPTMHAAVLARAHDHGDAVARHRLRFIRSSSAALPVPVLEGLEATFAVPVIEAYGMTEAAHQMAANPLPPRLRKPGTVGLPAGLEIAIADEAGYLLGPGAVGEVVIRGSSVFAGYEANPEANGLAFFDGWFRTGDEGFLDEEGYLTLRGRIKEIINRGGEKIAPLEIDAALLRHPAVEQAVAFAMDDSLLGEEVAAAVVAAPGASVDTRSLQDFVADQLAPFKVPRRIVLLDEIPKGPTGKVQRVGLATRLGLNGHAETAANREPYGFLERDLVSIWASVLDIPSVRVTDDFFALGGDSILGAEAVARVRDLVGDPNLPFTSIVRAPTPAAMAREIFAGLGAGESGVVPLQTSGDRTPIFFVHPGDGDVLAFPVLARRLGADQPSYALRCAGLDDERSIPSSLEQLAADYVSDIQQVQSEGPYVLGGFCLGAVIAFEMAAQLEAAGQEVAMLVLLDPRFGRPGGLRYHLWLARRRSRERRLARALARRITRKAEWFEHTPEDPPGATELHRAFTRIRLAYRPRPSRVRATVLLSQGFRDFDLPTWYVRRVVRPQGWSQVDCLHRRLLLPPNVDRVAGEIRAALDETLSTRRSR